MQIQLVSHASVLIRTQDVQIWTDPWLTGKVFNNSWTLLHEPAEAEYRAQKVLNELIGKKMGREESATCH